VKLSLFVKRLALYLLIGFVVILIWWSPEQTSTSAREFLAAIGGSLKAMYDQLVTFLKGLSGKTS